MIIYVMNLDVEIEIEGVLAITNNSLKLVLVSKF